MLCGVAYSSIKAIFSALGLTMIMLNHVNTVYIVFSVQIQNLFV